MELRSIITFFTARSQKRDITIQFFGAESDFFDSINGLTCEDLDISSLNQVYDSTAKNGAKKSSSGIVNPLISYEEDLTTNVVLPSFYYKSLLELIAGLSGKTFAGAIMSDERLIKTILPWSRNKDINSDPQYRTSKEVKALSNGQTIVLSGGWTTVEFPNVIYQGEDGFWNGNTYSVVQPLTPSGYYTFDVIVRLKDSIVSGNGAQYRLSVNGTTTETFNGGDTFFQSASPIAGQDGFTVRIQAIQLIGASTIEIDSSSYIEIKVNAISIDAYLIESAKNLFAPIPLKDFVRDFAVRHGIIFKESGNEIFLKTFEEIISDKSGAVDWTGKRDQTRFTSEIEFQLSGVSQVNNFSYENQDDNVPEDLGQGSFLVANELLPLDSDVSSIFSNTGDAFTESEKVNYLVIPAIETGETDFDLSGYRIAMIKENPEDPTQWTTYFVDGSETKDLSFSGYLTDHYNLLVKSIQSAKIVTRNYNLSANDVLNYDPHKLIYDDGSYYLGNEIKNFIPGVLTQVELLKVV